jgi:hypothetical protein
VTINSLRVAGLPLPHLAVSGMMVGKGGKTRFDKLSGRFLARRSARR